MNYIVKPFKTNKKGDTTSWAVWDIARDKWHSGMGSKYKFSVDHQAERLNADLRQSGEGE